ncbi:chaplin [Streptomyces sp. NPDC013178]|uniref:chaplin n=1 Tax=unclassified Streptomyces TaxID=2593676 RepID=UPI003403288F
MRHVTRKSLMTVAAATGVIAAAGGYAHAASGASGSASHSPGVLSGNTVQAPVDVPVNVCGNTVDVIGILNPAVGNTCANHSGNGGAPGGYGDEDGPGGGYGDDEGSGGGYGDQEGTGGGHGGSGAHGSSGGAHAGGSTVGSPGVASGNHVEVPVHVPVNVCGNSVDVGGVLNPAAGNDCANDSGPATRPGTTPGGDQTPGRPGNQGPGTPDDSGPSRSQGGSSTADHVTPAGASTARQPVRATTAQLAHTGSELPMGVTLSAGAGALLAGAVLYRRARTSA